MILAPIAVFLMVLAIVQSIYGIVHELDLATYPANPNGISSTRRDVTLLYNVAAGIAGPAAAALLWFDWIGSGMTKRGRISLIGYLCGTIAAMALFLIVKSGGRDLKEPTPLVIA